jgi:hypothetical protein
VEGYREHYPNIYKNINPIQDDLFYMLWALEMESNSGVFGYGCACGLFTLYVGNSITFNTAINK